MAPVSIKLKRGKGFLLLQMHNLRVKLLKTKWRGKNFQPSRVRANWHLRKWPLRMRIDDTMYHGRLMDHVTFLFSHLGVIKEKTSLSLSCFFPPPSPVIWGCCYFGRLRISFAFYYPGQSSGGVEVWWEKTLRAQTHSPITVARSKLVPRRTLNTNEGTLGVDGLDEVLVGPDVVATEKPPQGIGSITMLLQKSVKWNDHDSLEIQFRPCLVDRIEKEEEAS